MIFSCRKNNHYIISSAFYDPDLCRFCLYSPQEIVNLSLPLPLNITLAPMLNVVPLQLLIESRCPDYMKQIYYKMKRIFLFQFWMLSAAFLISCTNDEQPELYDQNEDFVPGHIIIGINSDVSIDQVFNLINEQGLFIDYMSGFYSYSTLPTDSISYVVNYLKNKPFKQKRIYRWLGLYFRSCQQDYSNGNTF